jgi:hypothetical protein
MSLNNSCKETGYIVEKQLLKLETQMLALKKRTEMLENENKALTM